MTMEPIPPKLHHCWVRAHVFHKEVVQSWWSYQILSHIVSTGTEAHLRVYIATNAINDPFLWWLGFHDLHAVIPPSFPAKVRTIHESHDGASSISKGNNSPLGIQSDQPKTPNSTHTFSRRFFSVGPTETVSLKDFTWSARPSHVRIR